jgi:hypothetical protein
VSRVYWESITSKAGIVAGPLNVTLFEKQGGTLVNEYNASGTITSVAGVAKFATGAGAGAAGSALGQVFDTGTVDVGKLVVDTAIGGVTNFIPGPVIQGVTAGRNSFVAVAESTITKLANNTIESASFQTAERAVIGLSTKSLYGDVANSLFDSFFGGAVITPAYGAAVVPAK